VAIIPATRVYYQRAPEGTAYPHCTYEFEDISAFFGGTEYYSGRDYQKMTRVKFAIFAEEDFDFSTLAQVMSNAFGWSVGMPGGQWEIPNAEILGAMPEVEGIELPGERHNGKDIVKYTSSFTLTMQADRG
jgi:hypothetical protein